MFGIIYLVKNTVNGKVYVGQTTGTLQRRWSRHKQNANGSSQRVIHRAIRKYGPEAFTQTILAEANTQQELDALEIRFISEYKARDPKLGYNCAVGGSNPRVGAKHSAETIAKLKATWARKKAEGYRNPVTFTTKGRTFKGRKWTESQRALLMESRKSVWTPERRAEQAKRFKQQILKDPTMSRRGGIKGSTVRWGKVN